jgi:hypothetical protein
MAIVQDAFYIPDDIATGLATGLYRRIGSVVRYAVGPNKGQIVKHLKPIDLKTAEEAQGIGVKALQFVKQHKKASIIIMVGAAAVGAGAWAYNTIKNREPKVVTDFRASLKVYIDAIRAGNMDVEKINNLMGALEELKKHKDYEKISIQLTSEELGVLVDRIYEYTIKLAKDNDVDLREEELNTADMKNAGTFINLQNYLKAQKIIFEAAA